MLFYDSDKDIETKHTNEVRVGLISFVALLYTKHSELKNIYKKIIANYISHFL